MTPLHVLSLGKSLWDLYEEISDRDISRTSEERSDNTFSTDLDLSESWKWFKRDEFACACCNQNRISGDLVDRLDYARGKAGMPFQISSGYRCINRNRKVKGKPRSSHLDGYASDIKCRSVSKKDTIVASLFSAGIKRVGIYKTFVHADISPDLPTPMLWIE